MKILHAPHWKASFYADKIPGQPDAMMTLGKLIMRIIDFIRRRTARYEPERADLRRDLGLAESREPRRDWWTYL